MMNTCILGGGARDGCIFADSRDVSFCEVDAVGHNGDLLSPEYAWFLFQDGPVGVMPVRCLP